MRLNNFWGVSFAFDQIKFFSVWHREDFGLQLYVDSQSRQFFEVFLVDPYHVESFDSILMVDFGDHVIRQIWNMYWSLCSIQSNRLKHRLSYWLVKIRYSFLASFEENVNDTNRVLDGGFIRQRHYIKNWLYSILRLIYSMA